MTEISPDVQKALDEQKENCVFCKIIAGTIPSKKVFEDDLVLGILDINPACKGHILLMPKEHYPIMPFLPAETFRRLFGITKRLCGSIKKGIVTPGSSVFIANGFVAGQQSQHFMIHLIPRDDGDGLPFSIKPGAPVDETALDNPYKAISGNLFAMVENHLLRNPEPWHVPRKQSYTKEDIIALIGKNPPLQEMIEKNPEGFISLSKTHEQLSPLFKDIDAREIVMHFNPDASEKKKEGDFEVDAREEDENLDDGQDDRADQDIDLDDVSRLFR